MEKPFQRPSMAKIVWCAGTGRGNASSAPPICQGTTGLASQAPNAYCQEITQESKEYSSENPAEQAADSFAKKRTASGFATPEKGNKKGKADIDSNEMTGGVVSVLATLALGEPR